MSYESVSIFSQIGGMFFFAGLFIVVVVYALWPRNKSKFDKAAHMPIDDESLED